MSQRTVISNGSLSATIDSDGAQLVSLAKGGEEYLWQGDPKWWDRSAPVLFPVVGAPGSEVQRSVAGESRIPKHGFARDFEHRIVEVTTAGDAVTYEFSDSPSTREIYPYAFTLRMTYAITGPSTLSQTFRVENTGSEPMPFSVGGHPAFNVPVPGTDGETFEDYELHFAEPWTASSPKVVEGGLLSYADPFPVVENSDTVRINRSRFDFDTIVLRDVPSNTVTLQGMKSGRGVQVDFPGFDFIGIWSAQPDAPFIALEPWTGHAATDTDDDVLEHRDNITILEPGKMDERSFSITLL
ncbi:aldose 1-epimerase family protein [Bifidobacterium tsurumiense]|uniref:aldose 1-epimerase family protein n=1 Tax=Bifidobacterium tsurumiense TaxID=356829 RepID=UPI0012B19822|nr:aldose 1-epimerase family protein [Bifidobacterium tsurumiense]MDY4678386.1 aldose 1-epimerase family protein [Bifidobacterium tsurumiense]MSS12609.1 aldose 1-epimerase family protein [Bifidobacterium tsurumiense]